MTNRQPCSFQLPFLPSHPSYPLSSIHLSSVSFPSSAAKQPPNNQLEVWGSAESSPSGVRGRAPAAVAFCCIVLYAPKTHLVAALISVFVP